MMILKREPADDPNQSVTLDRRFCLGLFVLASLVVLGPAVRADVVYLKSGNTIEGAVVGETENEVTIRMDEGLIALDRTEIRRIDRGPQSVVEQDGSEPAPEKPGEAMASGSVKTSEETEMRDTALDVMKRRIEQTLGVPLTTPVMILLVGAVLFPIVLFLVWRSNSKLKQRLDSLEQNR